MCSAGGARAASGEFAGRHAGRRRAATRERLLGPAPDAGASRIADFAPTPVAHHSPRFHPPRSCAARSRRCCPPRERICPCRACVAPPSGRLRCRARSHALTVKATRSSPRRRRRLTCPSRRPPRRRRQRGASGIARLGASCQPTTHRTARAREGAAGQSQPRRGRRSMKCAEARAACLSAQPSRPERSVLCCTPTWKGGAVGARLSYRGVTASAGAARVQRSLRVASDAPRMRTIRARKSKRFRPLSTR